MEKTKTAKSTFGFIMSMVRRTVRIKEGHLHAGLTGTVTEWWPYWGVTVRMYVDGREVYAQYLIREIELINVEQTAIGFLSMRFERISIAYKRSDSNHLNMVLHRRRQKLFNEIAISESAARASVGIKRGLAIWKGGLV